VGEQLNDRSYGRRVRETDPPLESLDGRHKGIKKTD
jgi:hypothetical protein